jgi:peptidoglycan/LPS O-acetylase OafA/YrhL
MKRAYNPYVHGFRGFAAFSVLVFHLFAARILPPFDFVLSPEAWTFITASLKYGVELFFMISGYVILGSLVRHASIRDFFKDRFLRIYPAFVPVHILVFILGPFVGWGLFRGITVNDYISDFIANLLFLPTIFPVPLAHWAAWSLSYEWLFYFLCATTLVMLRRTATKAAVFAALAALVAVLLNFYPRGLFFIPGVIAFAGEGWILAHRRWFALPFTALGVFLCAWSLTGVDLSQPSSQLIHWLMDRRIAMLLAAFAAGLYLIAAVICGRGVFGQALSSAPMQFLGTISYSFYLWHPIVVVAAKRLVTHYFPPPQWPWLAPILFVCLCVGGSLAAGWSSWRLFEVGFSHWLRDTIWPRRTRDRPVSLESALKAENG